MASYLTSLLKVLDKRVNTQNMYQVYAFIINLRSNHRLCPLYLGALIEANVVNPKMVWPDCVVIR